MLIRGARLVPISTPAPADVVDVRVRVGVVTAVQPGMVRASDELLSDDERVREHAALGLVEADRFLPDTGVVATVVRVRPEEGSSGEDRELAIAACLPPALPVTASTLDPRAMVSRFLLRPLQPSPRIRRVARGSQPRTRGTGGGLCARCCRWSRHRVARDRRRCGDHRPRHLRAGRRQGIGRARAARRTV